MHGKEAGSPRKALSEANQLLGPPVPTQSTRTQSTPRLAYSPLRAARAKVSAFYSISGGTYDFVACNFENMLLGLFDPAWVFLVSLGRFAILLETRVRIRLDVVDLAWMFFDLAWIVLFLLEIRMRFCLDVLRCCSHVLDFACDPCVCVCLCVCVCFGWSL